MATQNPKQYYKILEEFAMHFEPWINDQKEQEGLIQPKRTKWMKNDFPEIETMIENRWENILMPWFMMFMMMTMSLIKCFVSI